MLDTGESVLATNDASIIVAVSPTVVDFLGYRSESDLLGRRISAVVPLNVPVVRADGTEAHVDLRVVACRLDNDHHVSVAHLGT